MKLDTTEQLITWKYLAGKQSKCSELPSEHIAIDVLEFPQLGGKTLMKPLDPKLCRTTCQYIVTQFLVIISNVTLQPLHRSRE
eukprot:8031788-Karenia_brevis.AAC.1